MKNAEELEDFLKRHLGESLVNDLHKELMLNAETPDWLRPFVTMADGQYVHEDDTFSRAEFDLSAYQRAAV